MHMKHFFFLFIAVSIALASAGCKGSGSEGSGSANSGGGKASVTITPAARAEAEQLFSSRCATCHGPQGKGNGPASAGLDPKPRNFTNVAWQKKVTDEHIEKIIQYGGASVGLSAAMPANPDLQAKPAVVAALREHVRSLSGK